jgi:putative ABC transport system ATP-binding protein
MIELRKISKTYEGKGIQTKALKDINLKIKEGEFAAVMGKSGCGKTTLLNILGCMDRFDDGEYLFNNTDIKTLDKKQLALFRNKNIGFIFQAFHLINDMTAVENVELPLGLAGVKAKEMRDKAMKLLEYVGMEDKALHRPAELSGGQQQRVAIARALANNPKVIFADEPTGNLDEECGIQVMNLLKELKDKNGVTIIMVTHDPDIAQYADYTIHMKDGNITSTSDNCLTKST